MPVTTFVLSSIGIALVLSGIFYKAQKYSGTSYIDKSHHEKLQSLANKFRKQLKIYEAEKSKYNAQKIRDISEIILEKLGNVINSVQQKELGNVNYDEITKNINNLSIKETIDLVNNFLKTYKHF